MPPVPADRSLLFGVLALQLDFVSREDLIAATRRGRLDPGRPLGDVFVEQKLLSVAESQLIESVVQKHLDRNNNDPRQSLQSIEAFESIRSTLDNLEGAGEHSTLEFDTLPMRPPQDSFSTKVYRESEAIDAQQRYKVLRLHQKGGLGRVSIALDEELNREIALKEILASHADDIENRSRFIWEAEITGALEHPGVVPVYSLGKFADGRPYYAMRFIRGMNLQMALEDFHKAKGDSAAQQLQFRQLLRAFIDVCYTLEYAHSRGVIHRDLKPSNVMLGDYGETLVVDWGLAKTLAEGFDAEDSIVAPVATSDRASSTQTVVGRAVGTPAYMSPEQAAGRLDSLGPSSDIYSLGATLYHLLTGQVAFTGTEEVVLGNVQLGRFAQPREVHSDVPRALEAICLKAMARMQSERYGSGRELAADLERYLAGERVVAYKEPLTASAWRWIRYHKPLVYSSAAALAVTLTAMTVSVVMLSSANVRVRASRDEATRSYQEADRERQRAERNFGLARDAVREYYISVSEETLLKQPGMQPLRENLLRQALVYYQSFLEERQDDLTLLEEVAQAHFFTGQITQAIDSPAKALPHYQSAAEAQQQLLAESPKTKDLATAYGKTLNAMGDASLRLGRLAEASDYFGQAIEVRDRLAKEDAEDVESARMLASSVMNSGFVHYMEGDYQGAILQMNRAQGIRMAHTANKQNIATNLQRDLGMGYYNLALAYSAVEETQQAESNFLSAIGVFDELLAHDPDDMNNRRKLAVCHRMVGELQGKLGNSAKATEYYQRAQEALEALQMRNPDLLEFSSDLAGVYLHLGLELAKQKETEAALESLDQAIDLLYELIEQTESVPRFRLDLGRSLREAGKLLALDGQRQEAIVRLQESKGVLSQLVKEDPSNDDFLSELQTTADDLARVTASEEKAILEEAAEPSD